MLTRFPASLLDCRIHHEVLLEHRERPFQPPAEHELGGAVAVGAGSVAVGSEEGFAGEAGAAGLDEEMFNGLDSGFGHSVTPRVVRGRKFVFNSVLAAKGSKG